MYFSKNTVCISMKKKKTINMAGFILALRNFGVSSKAGINSQGLTLVELMVTFTVLLLLISSVCGMLTSGGRLCAINGAQMDISASARNAISRMSEELSQTGRNTVNISSGGDLITFQIPSSFAAGSVSWGNQIQYSLGGLNGQQLLRTDLGDGSVTVLGNYISLLKFNQIASDMIEIQLTLSKQSVKGDILTMNIGSQIRLRNE